MTGIAGTVEERKRKAMLGNRRRECWEDNKGGNKGVVRERNRRL